MVRPSKKTVHCRTIASKRNAQPIHEVDLIDEIESDSDNEALLLGDDSACESSISDVSVEKLLIWKENASLASRSAYTGDSRWTAWRRESKKQKRHDAVKSDPKIWRFFPKKDSPVSNSSNAVIVETPIQRALDKIIQQVNIAPNMIREKHDRATTKWDFARKLAVRNYLQSLVEKNPKIESSERIASLLFPDRNVSHSGRLIRQWTNHYIENLELPVQTQGKFVKVKSLIHDEDVQRTLREFIRLEREVALTSTKLASWVNENLHLKIGFQSQLQISSRTGQRWLNILGLRFGKFMTGLYTDGHERSDVVLYRSAFLERMSSYEKRMIQYVGDCMETAILPELPEGSKVLILVTHDESCFGSNDGRNFCWIDENNRQIRPKGNGRSVMVSAFLCECHGVLKLTPDLQAKHPDIPADSTVYLKPGANSEGYWKNSDLVDQVRNKAIPIFKILHPDCDGLFVFDNSQNHHAKAPDALSVTNMNLKNGGVNQRLMRDGWYKDGNSERIAQKMVLEDGVTSKGLAVVLKERGLWPESGSMSVKEAKQRLSKEEDFRDQKEWLEETVIDGGCQIDFYPKYHCEFNYIEMFWGAAKAWSRARCTFNFNDHVALVPKAIDSVSIAKIRKFARKSYRYMDAYRLKHSNEHSLTCRQIEYAVKKYRGHRKIPLGILELGNLLNE